MIISTRNNVLAFTLICATIGIQAAQNAPADLAAPFTYELDVSPIHAQDTPFHCDLKITHINEEGEGIIFGSFSDIRKHDLKIPQRISFHMTYNKNNTDAPFLETNPSNSTDPSNSFAAPSNSGEDEWPYGYDHDSQGQEAFDNVTLHCVKHIALVRNNTPIPATTTFTLAENTLSAVTCISNTLDSAPTTEGVRQLRIQEKAVHKKAKVIGQKAIEAKNAANKQPSSRLTIKKSVILGFGMLAAKKLYEHRETIASAVSLTVVKLTQGHASVV